MKILVLLTKAAMVAGIVFILAACGKNEDPGPGPVINSFYPGSGVIGAPVTIMGDRFIPTVPPGQGVGPHPNTSMVAFNGTAAKAEYVYQDSIGQQRITTTVPPGATDGKITVTSNGQTASSAEAFSVTKPIYLPNVEVTTVPGWGLDIAIDKEGSLFLTHNNPVEIVKVTPNTVQTLWSSSGTEVPWGIAVDSKGNVFATNVFSQILKIDMHGKASILAGTVEAGDVDGPGASARFSIPLGIDVDKDGNLYVADFLNYKIRKITPEGTVSTLAGSTEGYQDGAGVNAQFQGPNNLLVDAEGTVYVADGPRLRKVSQGGQVTTVAGTVAGYRDGTIATAQFNGINGIAKDAAGNLYLADESNFVVRRIEPDGTVLTVAGSTFGSADGPGSLALFTQTLGMAIDENGHIYVTQGGGIYKVRKITIR